MLSWLHVISTCYIYMLSWLHAALATYSHNYVLSWLQVVISTCSHDYLLSWLRLCALCYPKIRIMNMLIKRHAKSCTFLKVLLVWVCVICRPAMIFSSSYWGFFFLNKINTFSLEISACWSLRSHTDLYRPTQTNKQNRRKKYSKSSTSSEVRWKNTSNITKTGLYA